MSSHDEREQLVALREKYREMQRLRAENDEDKAQGRTHVAPRDRLRALSHRFPGALAEVDRISPSLLEVRIATLDALLERSSTSAGELPTWVRGWVLVHRGLRGALAVKAWLAGARTVDSATVARFDEALPALSFPEEARLFRDRLAQVASPPDGRLMNLVLDDAASALGTDRVSLRALLMPRPQ